MKQILKKNQIIISVIAIMLITAGYMNYTSNEKQALETASLADTEKYAGIGDATLVSANVVDEENITNEDKEENVTENSEKDIKESEVKDETTLNEKKEENQRR